MLRDTGRPAGDAGAQDSRRAGRLLLKRVYYGWPMLIGLSVAETISWGVVYYAFSVFIQPMESELGWSRAQVTGGFSLALLVSALAAVPVGHWLDAHGARGVMSAGSLLAALLFVAWSRVQSLGAFYLLWIGLGLAMAATLYEPAFAVVATWFVRRRHRALTVLTIFGGLASTLFVPLAGWLLERQGWRAAVATLGAILAATTLPLHALLLRRRPQDLGLLPDGDAVALPSSEVPAPSIELRAALRSAAFWSLTSAFGFASLAGVAVCVHLIPYLVERQVPVATAAAMVGLMGAMQLPGRLLYAPLRKRMSPQLAMAATFLIQAVAVASLPWLTGGAGLWLFAAAFGMAGGLSTLLRASTVAEVFGQAHYGRISGVLAFFTTCARAAGPVGAALAYTALGRYDGVLWGLSALLLLAGLLAVSSGLRKETRWPPATFCFSAPGTPREASLPKSC